MNIKSIDELNSDNDCANRQERPMATIESHVKHFNDELEGLTFLFLEQN